MTFAENFIKNYFSSFSVINVTENDREFVCELTATQLSTIDNTKVQLSFDFLQPNDHLNFTIEFGQASPVTFHSATPDFAAFKIELEDEYSHQVGEPIKAIFIINKKNVSNNITIYDLEIFTNTLEKLNVAQVFTIFNRVLAMSSFVNFYVLHLDKSFNTSTIFFTQVGGNASFHKFPDRQKRLESLLSASNYTNIKEHKLTPDDFQIQIANEKYSRLCSLFNRYSALLSIIYLFDITTLNESQLEFKINGYKSIKGTIDANKELNGTEEYFNIYNWVYSGGNLYDKIGLARNIISLHFLQSGEIGMKGNPFQSIQSSYKVYEKQNIKQYIEIRNKISDQLLDFNNRANKVIETFASGFQKSSLALISFYISAIVIRVLSKGDFVNVFSLDATMLSIAFIFGSFIYYRVARWEVVEQRNRFVNSYTNLKERYTDLLEKEDIQRILNDDKEYHADVAFINSKLKAYSNLWKWFLIILLAVTVFLFCTYNLSQLQETYIWKLF